MRKENLFNEKIKNYGNGMVMVEFDSLPERLGKAARSNGKISTLDAIFPETVFKGAKNLFELLKNGNEHKLERVLDSLGNGNNEIIPNSNYVDIIYKLVNYVKSEEKYFKNKLFKDFRINKSTLSVGLLLFDGKFVINYLKNKFDTSLEDLVTEHNLNFSYVNKLIDEKDKDELYNYLYPFINNLVEEKNIANVWVYDADIEEYGMYEEDEDHDNEIDFKEESKEIQFYKNRIKQLEEEKTNMLNSIDAIIEKKLAEKLTEYEIETVEEIIETHTPVIKKNNIKKETFPVKTKSKEETKNEKAETENNVLNNTYSLENKLKAEDAFSEDASKLTVFNVHLRLEHIKDNTWRDTVTNKTYEVPTKYNEKKRKYQIDNRDKAKLIEKIVADSKK